MYYNTNVTLSWVCLHIVTVLIEGKKKKLRDPPSSNVIVLIADHDHSHNHDF